MKYFLFFAGLSFFILSCSENRGLKREEISLNGTWEVAESKDTILPEPERFNRKIQVPGLIDLAVPSFKNPGFKYAGTGRETAGEPGFGRKYFWYKKIVKLNSPSREFALLKVHKAKFGHAVYVNRNYVGKYDYCFTPSFFEIGKYLNYHSNNEIVIRIGASPEQLPDSIPFGFDIEKSVYHAGIYDNVELFMGDYPYIENIQIVPDSKNKKIKAIIYLENGNKETKVVFNYTVKEKNTGRPVNTSRTPRYTFKKNTRDTLYLTVDIPQGRLWSPEDPFLYEFEIASDRDSKKVNFGLREFRFDSLSRLALLNGKPYYLRGTNIAMHRFFEDTVRKDLPWQKGWIEKMHDEFKDMHWNAYRFHVGFAPEIWYEVADEKGFLIQDEYACWGLFLKDSSRYSTMQQHRHKATVLAREYAAWIRERWNHPSVVIWDAQNETLWDETGKAIAMVRHLDLSNRPWDNGFSPPQRSTDIIESHPYLFAHDEAFTFNLHRSWPKEGLLKHDLGKHPEPFNDPNSYEPPAGGKKYENPVVVNEYGWIWLYRDGSPSSVAESIWKFYPEFDSPEKRWEWRGRVIAAKTEYWRSRRDIAGVLYFCALTCDRPWEPRSQVSDDWYDVKSLVMQPLFKKYVKPAFSPVGIFIDRFDMVYSPGGRITVPVVLFNDLANCWKGDLILKIKKEETIVCREEIKNATVNPYQKAAYEFTINLPAESGQYEMMAEIEYYKELVFSSRIFRIK